MGGTPAGPQHYAVRHGQRRQRWRRRRRVDDWIGVAVGREQLLFNNNRITDASIRHHRVKRRGRHNGSRTHRRRQYLVLVITRFYPLPAQMPPEMAYQHQQGEIQEHAATIQIGTSFCFPPLVPREMIAVTVNRKGTVVVFTKPPQVLHVRVIANPARQPTGEIRARRILFGIVHDPCSGEREGKSRETLFEKYPARRHYREVSRDA